MRTKFKPWAVEYLKTNTKNELFISEEEKDIKDILSFINEKDTYLEIGPGKGNFIISLASRYPNYNFLVIELDKTISGIALKKIDESGLTNIRLISGNFYDLSKIIKNDAISGLFLNFSDPWPKKRHTKRRLTSPLFLVEYAKILKPNSKIYYKTDNDDFYAYSLETFKEYNWEILENILDYNELEGFDAPTEFEARFKAEGIKIKRIILKKNDKTLKVVRDNED